MIGIIGAMQVELDMILKEVLNLAEVHTKIKTFYTGQISGKDVVIVLAGIGKVNAGVTTSILIENFDVTSIINIGVAGGLNGVKHKDVVISKEVLYHDVDVTKYTTYTYGQIQGSEALFYADKALLKKTQKVLNKLNLNYKIGKIASGDQFVFSKEKIKDVSTVYNDIFAVEMEAAAIAHTATLYQIPFIIYRSISDILDDKDQHLDFDEFLEEAVLNATLVLKEVIKVI